MSAIQRFGPFITIGINLVVCGAIVYYFHRRLLSVESAFIKQNQIFSSFMVEFKRDINMQLQMQQHPSQQQKMYKEESGDVIELASPEAIKAVSINNKIEVSDDSESESESDSEEDSDDDEAGTESEAGSASEAGTESEAEEEIKTIDLTNMDIIDDHLYLNEADLGLSNQEIFQDMMNASMISNSFMHSTSGLSGSFVIISDDSSLSSSSDKKIIILNDEDSSSSDSDDEAEEEPLKIIKKSTPPPTPLIQTIDLEPVPVEPVSVIELQEEETPVIKKPVKAKKNIVLMDMETGIIEAPAQATVQEVATATADNMKVDDLRKLAVDKNLVTKENVKKMKKAELLTLLAQ